MTEQFKKEVEEGLSQTPKSLPSKYFYDKVGDALFVKIMHSSEYYLTRAEFEVFENKSNQIIDAFQIEKDKYFQLIELGAGDGLKTKELLKCLQSRGYNFDYFPVDISQNSLDKLEDSLKSDLPTLGIEKRQGDYFEILASLKKMKHPKVILFLGSNIGNMSDDIAAQFIYQLGSNLTTDDKLLLGVDLKKDASIVLPAYNDSNGITRAFNLNLLTRINKELGGNFDIEQFSHQPAYSEDEGIARSFLVSLKKQEVYIEALDKSFEFQKDEKIATEISRKYSDEIIERLIKNTDFKIVEKLMDQKEYFADYIFTRS